MSRLAPNQNPSPPRKKSKPSAPWLIYQDTGGDITVDTHLWQPSTRATKYANELRSCEGELLDPNDPESVMIFPLNTWLQSHEEDSPQLLLPYATRQVWDFVRDYCMSHTKTHAVVTGNQGVGKSRSMAYLLRSLLRRDQLVLYESRKDECWYAFVPSEFAGEQDDQEYFVYSLSSKDFDRAKCAAMKNPDNFHLIDPLAPISEKVSVAHTILAASPNEYRTKEFLKSDRSSVFIIPVWTESELLQVRQYHPIGTTAATTSSTHSKILSESDVSHRYHICGGVPRYIFKEYIDEKSLMDLLQHVSINDVVKVLTYPRSGMGYQASGNRVPSALFVLEIDRDLPESIEKYRYSSAFSVPASDFIRLNLVHRYYKDIMNMMDPQHRTVAVSDTELGMFLETTVTALLLVDGIDLEWKPLNDEPPTSSATHPFRLSSKAEHKETKKWKDFLNEWKKLSTVSSMGTQRSLVTGPSNQSVVDMVDAQDRAFQVTKSSILNLDGWKLHKYVTQLPNVSHQNPLKLYFMVPEHIYSDFKQQKYTFTQQNAAQKDVEQQLQKQVEQYAICVPRSLPEESTDKVMKKMKEEWPNIL